MNKELPLYQAIIQDEIDGFDLISIVKNPAVEINFLKFDENKPTQYFSIDVDKQIVTGVIMLADTPIYRNNLFYGEHYVMFSADTIAQGVEKYFSQNKTNLMSLNHNNDMIDAVMVESYVYNSKRGITPTEFDVPNGTWMGSFKILDKVVWNKIKNGANLNGFSIEGIFSQIPDEDATELAILKELLEK